MDLSLKNLVRAGVTAKIENIHVEFYSGSINDATSAARYITSDGFRFEIPLKAMGGTFAFPAEGKAIEFMRWIRMSASIAAAAALEEESKQIMHENTNGPAESKETIR